MRDCTTCRHAVWDCDGSYDEKYWPESMRPYEITGCDAGMDRPPEDGEECEEYGDNFV